MSHWKRRQPCWVGLLSARGLSGTGCAVTHPAIRSSRGADHYTFAIPVKTSTHSYGATLWKRCGSGRAIVGASFHQTIKTRGSLIGPELRLLSHSSILRAAWLASKFPA